MLAIIFYFGIVLVCQAAITKYHRLNGLNNKNLFLTVLETGKSKIKGPTDSVLGESFLPGLQRAAISLCAHMTFSFCALRQREREREWTLVSLPLLIRILIPYYRSSTFMTSSKPNYFPKASLPDAITWGNRVSTYGFRGDTNIQSLTTKKIKVYVK